MRISAQAKEETRRRIVDGARRLFAERGFEATTTRELASAAGIATGTLFNYFPSKEELGAWILAEAAREGSEDFRRQRHGEADLAEDLFAHAAAVLRGLGHSRSWAAEVLETAQSPLRWSTRGEEGAAERFRTEHLQTVSDLLIAHGQIADAVPMTLHLYWTLFLGVVAFWSTDRSPHQQDTLALLDRALGLFARSLAENT